MDCCISNDLKLAKLEVGVRDASEDPCGRLPVFHRLGQEVQGFAEQGKGNLVFTSAEMILGGLAQDGDGAVQVGV